MSLHDLDISIFRAVNGLGFGPLDWLFVQVSKVEMGLASAAVVGLYFAWRKRWDAVWVILAGVIAVALSDSVGARLLKPLFGRARPCFALPPGSVRLLVPIADSGSMPSLHAANNFAAALVALSADRQTGWVLLPYATLVALSRLGVGVHWPSDLVGGVLWGAVAAGVGWAAASLGRAAWRRLRGTEKTLELP